MTPPPNPHADAARAALREYGSALFKNAPAAPTENDLNLNDESIDLLERVLEKHGELTDEAKIAAARATWPAMRLLDEATIGPGMWWCEACGMSHERDGVVVVTVEGREHE